MPRIKLLTGFLTSLFFIFSTASAFAVKLSGEWKIEKGVSNYKMEQSGDSFSLITLEASNPDIIGKAKIKGTISGSAFTGEIYLGAPQCPNLSYYVPAKGTISNNSLEVTYQDPLYDPDTCTETGKLKEFTYTFNRILSPEEEALQDHLDQVNRFAEDLANRPGPTIDLSDTNSTVVSTSPVAKSEKYSVNVGADTRPDLSTYVDYLGQTPNIFVPVWGKEIARISDFAGNLILHKTYKGEAADRETYRTGTSIHYNTLHEGDTFSFQGEGFIQYHGVDGSVKQFMTAGYAKDHGYADQIKPGQAGLEIILEPAKPVPVPPAPPGPVQKFFDWLGELLTPEPQPTPYGIVGVKG